MPRLPPEDAPPAPAKPGRGRGLAWAAAAAVAACLGFALILTLPEGRLRQDLDNVTMLMATAAGAAGVAWAALRMEGKERRAWGLMAAACVAWGFGGASWTTLQWLNPEDIPFPSIADVGYVGFYVFAIAGVAAFIGLERAKLGQARLLLSGLLGGLAVFLISWDLVLREVYAAAPADPLAQTLGLAYPILDAVLLTGVVVRLGRAGRLDVPMGLMAVGLFGITIADGFYAIQSAEETYVVGTLVDMGWFAGFLAVGLAGVAARPRGAAQGRGEAMVNRWVVAAPYLPVAIVMALVVRNELFLDVENHVLIVGAIALVAVAMARQEVVFEENRRLAERLTESRRELIASIETTQESETRFRQLAESLSSVFVLLDARTNEVIYVSPAYDRVYRRPREQLLRNPMDWLNAVHPDDRPGIEADLRQGPAAYLNRPLEVRLRFADGEVRWIRGHMVAVGGVSPPTRVAGLFEDVTELKRAEQGLRDSEARFKALVKGSSDATLVLDPEGRVTFATPAIESILGYTVDEAMGLTVPAIVHPDDRERAGAAMAAARSGPTLSRGRVRHKDGSWRWLESRSANLLDEPTVRGIVVNIRDVTELVRAEQGLRDSEARFKALVKGSSDATLVLDARGKVTFSTPAIEAMLGYPVEEVMAMEFGSMVHAEDLEGVRVALAETLAGKAAVVRGRVRARDGAWRVLEMRTTNLLGEPAVRGIVANVRDVTELVRAEDAAREAEAQEAEAAALREVNALKTQFINRAAHELSTPMTPMQLKIDLLARGKHGPLTAAQRDDVESLRRNLARFAAVVRDLLDAARGEGPPLLPATVVDLSPLLREAAAAQRDAAADRGIEVTVEAPEGGVEVRANREELFSVLGHLLDNALKFTPRGGRVLVQAVREVEAVEVRVADTGEGFPPERAKELFTPFSQLHDPMQRTRAGTGLSLYLARRAVEHLGGTIGGSSPGPGQGATFWFRLPLAAREAEAEAEAPGRAQEA